MVKHSWSEQKDFIINFLREHQSMGIYLYGELSMSKNKTLKSMANKAFDELKAEMDSGTVTNIRQLIC